jgi:hypothetical protein
VDNQAIDAATKNGHGVAPVGCGLDPQCGHFVLRNSWGACLAQGGYAPPGFAHCRRHGVDAYIVDVQ